MLFSFLNIGMMTSSTQAQKWSASQVEMVRKPYSSSHQEHLDRYPHRWHSPAGPDSPRPPGQSQEFPVFLSWQKISPCYAGNSASLCGSRTGLEIQIKNQDWPCQLTWSCPPMFWDNTRTCWAPEYQTINIIISVNEKRRQLPHLFQQNLKDDFFVRRK